MDRLGWMGHDGGGVGVCVCEGEGGRVGGGQCVLGWKEVGLGGVWR